MGFKLAFAGLAVAVPLLGVWIASSLAVSVDGPVWLAVVVGALCFPVLPVGWDIVASWRMRRRQPGREPILTRWDRLILRTLGINLVFVGGLLAAFPATVFSALSARGDWMLEQSDAGWADNGRQWLHDAADRMQWLHELTHPNAYTELIDDEATGKDVEVEIDPDQTWKRRPTTPSTPDTTRAAQDVFSQTSWPFVATLHPIVSAIGPEHEGSPEAVGRYIAQHEPDATQRLKAVHDYVADRIAYDVPAYKTRNFPPQDAQTVLRTGTGVCAGYAQLVKAIGDAAGLEVVVVVGKTRAYGSLGHAWNAAKVDGRWMLLDATWDAGSVDDAFKKNYRPWYLMTPPDVFLTDHIPDDPKWQLRADPISLGEFMRRPDLDPQFFAWGLELVTPARSHVSVKGDSIDVQLKNPDHFAVSGSIFVGDNWDGPRTRCTVTPDHTSLSCPLDTKGPHLVVLFGPTRSSMGKIHVAAQ